MHLSVPRILACIALTGFLLSPHARAQADGTQIAIEQAQQAVQQAQQAAQQANEAAMRAAQQAAQQTADAAMLSQQSPCFLPSIPPRPVANPPLGNYPYPIQVTLHAGSSLPVDIYYTLDGSKPTRTSTRYTTPIPLHTTTRLRAIAIAPNGRSSRVANIRYILH